jgi:hypothetical protein
MSDSPVNQTTKTASQPRVKTILQAVAVCQQHRPFSSASKPGAIPVPDVREVPVDALSDATAAFTKPRGFHSSPIEARGLFLSLPEFLP